MGTNDDMPNWLETRYSLLLERFGIGEFKAEEAVRFLMEKNKDNENEIPVYLSELRKRGWLEAITDTKDARRKIYKIISKGKKLKDLISSQEGKLNRADLEALLKRAADLIRTSVDYKFILIMLFLKRISDVWELEYEKAYKEALADGLSEEEAKKEAKSGAYHSFDLPEEYQWEKLRNETKNLPERFSSALKELAVRNPEFKDIIDSVDFIQFTSSIENAEILRQLVELFSQKKLHHVSPDVLGDAYEWIVRYFAPTKAKEGEIYTPREVISLLIHILDPKPKESVYDPACGSGGMLIESYRHVKEKKGKSEADKLFLFGQEVNQRTVALAKMNMFIHDIQNSHLQFGNTFMYPKFKGSDSKPRKFNVVIANPPWNQDGYGEDVLKKAEFWDERFGFGFSPQSSADWAWIQHMLYSAEPADGRVGVVIDNGALFRGGAEKLIRQKVLEKDWIEAVILLPEKLFYNTGAPGGIIILNKNKKSERKGRVLFINASLEFAKHPDVRKLNILSEDNIKKITSAYMNFSEENGFSLAVPVEKIRDESYTLNVTLYVASVEEHEEIDIEREWGELKKLEEALAITEGKIAGYLNEVR